MNIFNAVRVVLRALKLRMRAAQAHFGLGCEASGLDGGGFMGISGLVGAGFGELGEAESERLHKRIEENSDFRVCGRLSLLRQGSINR